MAAPRSSHASTSYTSATTSYPSNTGDTTTGTHPITSRSGTDRPRTRARTAASTVGARDQQIVCAVTESRGVSPTVGLAFVNVSTTEAVLCQICDTQTYVRTLHKIWVFEPTVILFHTTATQPKSTLFSLVETNLQQFPIVVIDRKYWAETAGEDYIQQLAFKQDVEAIKVSIGGNYYAVCCFAAVLKYVELSLNFTFTSHSMRIKYEPSEGSMMIDLSTIHALELIQNLQNAKSKDCLFGILNHTLTPMGSRLLRNNILQPSTSKTVLLGRYDAIEELASKEEVFFATRQALKGFLDVDRLLTAITIIPTKPSLQYWEQSINNVIMLKQYVKSVAPVFEALTGVQSQQLLHIRQLCEPVNIIDIETLIDENINEDTAYQSQPLDLRNQRTYAVKSGVNGLLDVARQTYKEANQDAYELVTELGQRQELALEIKYDTARQYYIRILTSELEERNLADEFINVFRRKKFVECQTLDLVKLNQKISDSHIEVLQMSDQTVQTLIDDVRQDVAPLFKICEGIALLDMLASFAHSVTIYDYTRPELTSTLALKSGRHPIRERIHKDPYIPNDAYATQQSRFQIITGCNMSGKSTYIRAIALMAVMAQIGSFVPAQYASFPITHQLFARISMDNNIEANVSTFAAEMRETAFILANIDKRSLVIVDELGRGTSTRDGLCIAIAIAEALVDSGALIWFATHFRDLAHILAERNGVVNLHLAVDMSGENKMTMLYKISSGCVQEQHYGIALAKSVALFPPEVIKVAEEVSNKLAKLAERRKKGSKAVVLAKRRKLILNLREQLEQARDGNMQDDVLWSWLKKLQDEFVRRMSAVEAEAQAADEESDEEKSGEGEDVARRTSVSRDGRGDTADRVSTAGDEYMMVGALQSE